MADDTTMMIEAACEYCGEPCGIFYPEGEFQPDNARCPGCVGLDPVDQAGHRRRMREEEPLVEPVEEPQQDALARGENDLRTTWRAMTFARPNVNVRPTNLVMDDIFVTTPEAPAVETPAQIDTRCSSCGGQTYTIFVTDVSRGRVPIHLTEPRASYTDEQVEWPDEATYEHTLDCAACGFRRFDIPIERQDEV